MLPLMNKRGKVWHIYAAGINEIYPRPIFVYRKPGDPVHVPCAGYSCRKCLIGSSDYSIQEEGELALIEKGLEYDASNKEWIAHYPWIKNPNTLKSNITTATARLKSTERRLKKLGTEYIGMYQNELEEMLKRTVACKLTKTELREYDGPIYYIQHHGVLKPE